MKILKRVGQNNEILAMTERWLEQQNGKRFNKETLKQNNALLDKAQAILFRKMARKRQSSISEIREKSHPDKPYRAKNLYIDGQINRQMSYFSLPKECALDSHEI